MAESRSYTRPDVGDSQRPGDPEYHELLPALASAVVVVDVNGRILRHTPRFRALIGEGVPLVGKPFSSLFAAEHQQLVDDCLLRAIKDGDTQVTCRLHSQQPLTMTASKLVAPEEFEGGAPLPPQNTASRGLLRRSRRRVGDGRGSHPRAAATITVFAEGEADGLMRTLLQTDGLTGVGSRIALQAALSSLTRRPGNSPVTLALADMDHLKRLNDTYGHAACDIVIQQTAKRLAATVGRAGSVFRVGGDEFVVLFPEMAIAEALKLLELARQAVELPIHVNDQFLQVTMSMGVTSTETLATSWDVWLHRADTAMYQAKATRRGTIRVYADEENRGDLARQAAQARLEAQERELEELRQQSRLDPLTGLLNRGAYEHDMATRHEVARRQADIYSLVLCDIDFFGKYNSQYALSGGDKALQAVAQTIKASCRPDDSAYRWGGEEFVIVLPQTKLEHAAGIAERTRAAVEALNLPHAGRPSPPSIVTISIGVAQFLLGSDARAADVFDAANAALRVAKESGRNRVQLCRSGGHG